MTIVEQAENELRLLMLCKPSTARGLIEEITRLRAELEQLRAYNATLLDRAQALEQKLSEARVVERVLHSKELIETLADVEHIRWSSWMKHQFSVESESRRERWRMLMNTPYSELTEELKDSDREEVRKTLAAIYATIEAAANKSEWK